LEFALFLIDHGITATEMQAAISDTFVQAAVSRARMKNGRVNQSRVAIMTGLTRPEVRRLVTDGVSVGATQEVYGAWRVIAGWNRDPEFLNAKGKPRKLALGRGHGTFNSLAQKYGADIPPRATLEELRRLNAISLRNGFAAQRHFPEPHSRRQLLTMTRLALQLSNLFQAIGYPKESAPTVTMFDGLTLDILDKSTLKIAERRVEQHARAFLSGLQSTAAYFDKKRRPSGKHTTSKLLVRVSVSAFSDRR
jgi:hypothetical protein